VAVGLSRHLWVTRWQREVGSRSRGMGSAVLSEVDDSTFSRSAMVVGPIASACRAAKVRPVLCLEASEPLGRWTKRNS